MIMTIDFTNKEVVFTGDVSFQDMKNLALTDLSASIKDFNIVTDNGDFIEFSPEDEIEADEEEDHMWKEINSELEEIAEELSPFFKLIFPIHGDKYFQINANPIRFILYPTNFSKN